MDLILRGNSNLRSGVLCERKSGKSAERKRKIRLIYLFAKSSAAPQLTNLSTATSRHLGFQASVKAATGFKRHNAFAGKTEIHSE